jgi:PadR family transcriptional regulator PadR
MGPKNNFFSGITELLILGILDNHDAYAYEIVKYIKESSGGFLAISQNTVYAATYKLENEGILSQYSKLVGKRRTRIYYHISEEGSAYYHQLLKNFRDAYNGVEHILQTLSERSEDSE